MDEKVKADTRALKSFIMALQNAPTIKVGVIGSKTHRYATDEKGKAIKASSLETKKTHKVASGESNAEIGAIHEYGLKGYPIRSFLRMPLTSNYFLQNLARVTVIGEQEIQLAMKVKSLRDLMKKIGAIAVETIQQSFDTEGWGTWPKWKTPGYKSNTGLILSDSQQLRKSITYIVE